MSQPLQFPGENKPFPQDLLRLYRNRADLSQDRMAELVGLSSSRMIQSWEGGFALPKPARLRKLLEIFYRHNAFLPGQELAEARKLWQAVKNLYETTGEAFRSYPLFDPTWFEKNVLATRQPGQPELPPARLPVRAAHPLPQPTGRVLGREKELAEILGLLLEDGISILTLTGVGGVGKTWLVQEICLKVRDRYRHGVFFIPLETADNPTDLLVALVKGLDLPQTDSPDLLDHLKTFLEKKEVLLALDNFEQLVAAAPVLVELTGAAPGLQLLLTSRESLRMPTERVYSLAPLPGPVISDLSSVAANPAVALFAERARLANPEFELNERNLEAVARLCIRLDNLPLAIGLAAGRASLLTPQQILNRLDNLFKILTSLERAITDRQKTLYNALEWSYRLLEPAEQALFCRLALFRGGCTVETAEAVCGFDNSDVLDGLESLVKKNLLQRVVKWDGEVRCQMLQTIREFAMEKLAVSGNYAIVIGNFVNYYRQMVETSEPKLRAADQKEALDRLEEEYANIRETLRLSLECADTNTALSIGGSLWLFWWFRGFVEEGRELLERTLIRPWLAGAEPHRAKALNAAGNLADIQGDLTAALGYFSESLEVYRVLEDKAGMARVLNNLGNLYSVRGEYQRAQEYLEQCLELQNQLSNRHGAAMALNNLGRVFRIMGDQTGSRRYYEQSLELLKEQNDYAMLAQVYSNISNVLLNMGDLKSAESNGQKSLQLARQTRNKGIEIFALQSLARAAFEQANLQAAIEYYNAALELCREVQDRLQTATCLDGLGRVLIETDRLVEAKTCLSQSQAIFVEVGSKQGQLTAFVSLAALESRQGDKTSVLELLDKVETLEKAWVTPLEPLEQSYIQRIKKTIATG